MSNESDLQQQLANSHLNCIKIKKGIFIFMFISYQRAKKRKEMVNSLQEHTLWALPVI